MHTQHSRSFVFTCEYAAEGLANHVILGVIWPDRASDMVLDEHPKTQSAISEWFN